jgi:hypothetical protein
MVHCTRERLGRSEIMIETSTRNVRVHSGDGVFEKASICKDSFLKWRWWRRSSIWRLRIWSLGVREDLSLDWKIPSVMDDWWESQFFLHTSEVFVIYPVDFWSCDWTCNYGILWGLPAPPIAQSTAGWRYAISSRYFEATGLKVLSDANVIWYSTPFVFG